MICDVSSEFLEKLINEYRDEYNLIVQKDFDGGDSAHRIGIYYSGMYLLYKDNKIYLTKLKKQFIDDLNKITVKNKFVRHPDQSKWYSNPNNFSRDQTTPLIIAMGFFDEKERIIENLNFLVKNKGFYPNNLKNWTNEQKVFPRDYNDFAGVTDYAHYVRSLKNKYFYPYLLISDISLFVHSIIRIYYSYYDETDTSDDLNFTLSIIQSEESLPTPLSKAAKFLYAKFKKNNSLVNSTNAIQSSWDYYFRPEALAPPLNEVYRCLIIRYFY